MKILIFIIFLISGSLFAQETKDEKNYLLQCSCKEHFHVEKNGPKTKRECDSAKDNFKIYLTVGGQYNTYFDNVFIPIGASWYKKVMIETFPGETDEKYQGYLDDVDKNEYRAYVEKTNKKQKTKKTFEVILNRFSLELEEIHRYYDVWDPQYDENGYFLSSSVDWEALHEISQCEILEKKL